MQRILCTVYFGFDVVSMPRYLDIHTCSRSNKVTSLPNISDAKGCNKINKKCLHMY